ncbi:MAG: DUF4276 family protein [Acidobacteria bacterium]|nr:DUF4276 family protein [Acidobacteriota bacterium]
MHIEFLVEEPSAEKALLVLIPKILGADITFAIHVFQGKSDLLKNLPSRLKGYKAWIPPDWRIVVLVDRDQQDCSELKIQLEKNAEDAGFLTPSKVGTEEAFQVLNRIAIEELEAWFFGDVEAIVSAYPKVSKHLGGRKSYRDPDAIQGGTWEALERVLQRKGYYTTGLPKIEAAQKIAEYMDVTRNRSKSFQVFRDALQQMRP